MAGGVGNPGGRPEPLSGPHSREPVLSPGNTEDWHTISRPPGFAPRAKDKEQLESSRSRKSCHGRCLLWSHQEETGKWAQARV